MAVFGKATGRGDGWTLRVNFFGGSFRDYGGQHITKQEAIDMMTYWETRFNRVQDIHSMQLFEFIPKTPMTLPGMFVTSLDRELDRELTLGISDAHL